MLIYHQLIGAGERAENKAIFPEFTKRIKSYKKTKQQKQQLCIMFIQLCRRRYILRSQVFFVLNENFKISTFSQS